MTRLEQAQEALTTALAALDAVHTEGTSVNKQEDALRRRYPASTDALERATISLALSQEIPALQRRIESRRLSAERDVTTAQEALQAVQGEIAAAQAAIAERTRRTGAGGYYDSEIARIRATADREIAALERAQRDEVADLPNMRRRLAMLGGDEATA